MTIGVQDRNKITVGVIRGGPSNEYDVSLRTGGEILKNMPDKYRVQDIFISRDGAWHIGGLERPPERILSQVDVVFNALHGRYGEDGKLQRILETHKIPFTGSSSYASAVAMHKGLAKGVYEKNSLKTPVHMVLYPRDNTIKNLQGIFKRFPQPSIIKPVSTGSSLGMTLATDFTSFKRGVEDALRHDSAAMVEEFIKGEEATCGVVDSNSESGIYALIPVELVRPQNKDFFDYACKYDGLGQEICPGGFSDDIKKQIQDLAIQAHKALGLRHYSRSDFIIAPKRGIYILETNSLPGLTEASLIPKSLKASGISLSDFIDHVLELALSE
ncbi:MAG: hypothetical protein A2741_00015 [Candidatus Zambryskibacteria bacterium RIFCSPHIGHO2_01_FULL_43_27]|uniref:D-alanine--D-alanine ligase n=1 Tax=Candidatus Zambryskibacteria bacterium RIFCSPLOWO2_01_FULL_43_17 TaxID=1802760 RepID=A0A1G2U619_9BACT|nr:MAG: hypothetical protein A2741_00015 [Candidatus Zambryskibacteria bacterium RIFCSPHIGHO2_01_FULL_43_27]OHB00830.1 MAG: hypothetical protein A3E93_03205 [Candidatus Zambryskibacteria bacterium RIFCSPHIGHO2_12_FULL_43_12b]OHB04390.1 MAG: hypothetical protein A2920_02095 [Candidatus Zambryskibacteria bacterium RIFCSPLOWO2_01_FULL_43_17]